MLPQTNHDAEVGLCSLTCRSYGKRFEDEHSGKRANHEEPGERVHRGSGKIGHGKRE